MITYNEKVTDCTKNCVEDDATQVIHEELVVEGKRGF